MTHCVLVSGAHEVYMVGGGQFLGGGQWQVNSTINTCEYNDKCN